MCNVMNLQFLSTQQNILIHSKFILVFTASNFTILVHSQRCCQPNFQPQQGAVGEKRLINPFTLLTKSAASW